MKSSVSSMWPIKKRREHGISSILEHTTSIIRYLGVTYSKWFVSTLLRLAVQRIYKKSYKLLRAWKIGIDKITGGSRRAANLNVGAQKTIKNSFSIGIS